MSAVGCNISYRVYHKNYENLNKMYAHMLINTCMYGYKNPYSYSYSILKSTRTTTTTTGTANNKFYDQQIVSQIT